MVTMVRYTQSLQGISQQQLQGGFFVGWPNAPAAQTHLELLRGSRHVVLALDEDGNVAGFITAISDGVLSAYIPFLEVLPAYQGQGIGTELVRRMLECLSELYMIDLVCDPQLQPFYERLGMTPRTGMIHRNYARQSGRA